MAQIIRLKRSNTTGEIPTTQQISGGEIALNVYDGKAFIRKSGSVDEVNEFVVTNTSVAIAGNINLQGQITASYVSASYFEGDGSLLTNLNIATGSFATTGSNSFFGNQIVSGSISASYFIGNGSLLTDLSIAQHATVKSSFTNSSTWVVTHNLDTLNPIVQVYDASDYQVIPLTLRISNNNTVVATFSYPESGYIVVAKGGHIVSGSIPWDNISDKPPGLVSGSEQIFLSGDVTGCATASVILSIDGGFI